MTYRSDDRRRSPSRDAARVLNGVGTFRGPLAVRVRRENPGVPASLARWTGFAVIVAAHEIELRYARCLSESGVSLRDFVLLSEIAQRQGISQGGLAQRLGLGRSRISEQLLVLDQAGFIEREMNEFDLRKRLGTDNNQLSLSGSDEVPAGFRTAIEEYYRKLAQRTQR